MVDEDLGLIPVKTTSNEDLGLVPIKEPPNLGLGQKLAKYGVAASKLLVPALQTPSENTTVLESAGKPLTMGYLPEIEAGALKLKNYLTQQKDAPTYNSLVSQQYARQAQNEAKNPEISNLATGAGVLAAGAGVAPAYSAANTALKSSALDALLGGLYNPGEKTPGDNSLQIPKRVGNAALGVGLGLAGRGLNKLANMSADISTVKDPIKRGEEALNLVKSGRDTLGKQGQGLSSQLDDILKDKSVAIAAEKYRGLSPEIDEILNKIKDGTISGPDLRELRSRMNNFAKFTANAPDAVAAAKRPAASGAYKDITQLLKTIDPSVKDLDAAMTQNARLQKFLTKGQERPIETLQPTPGSTRETNLARIDKATGLNLAKRGSQLKQAQSLVFSPKDLKTASGLATLIPKTATRGAVELAGRPVNLLKDILSSAPTSSEDSLIQILKTLQK